MALLLMLVRSVNRCCRDSQVMGEVATTREQRRACDAVWKKSLVIADMCCPKAPFPYLSRTFCSRCAMLHFTFRVDQRCVSHTMHLV